METLERKIEKLSRKDEEVAKALEEKQKIIADIFNIPPEDYDTITDLVVGTEDRKDAKDVLLAVMAQADSLARASLLENEPVPLRRQQLRLPPFARGHGLNCLPAFCCQHEFLQARRILSTRHAQDGQPPQGEQQHEETSREVRQQHIFLHKRGAINPTGSIFRGRRGGARR